MKFTKLGTGIGSILFVCQSLISASVFNDFSSCNRLRIIKNNENSHFIGSGARLFSIDLLGCSEYDFVESNWSHRVDDTSKMSETVVSTSAFQKRTWYSPLGQVQVITSTDIHSMPARTVSEILLYASGIDLRQRGPNGVQADLQMQGSTFDQVLLLINGVKMSDPQTGHHQLNLSISPEIIERIEIIKGAAAHVYGVNALAGVVNIITKTGNLQKDNEISVVNNSGRSEIDSKVKGSNSENLTDSKKSSGNYKQTGTYFSTQQGLGERINPSGAIRSKLTPEGNYYRSQSYRWLQQMGDENLSAWYSADVDFGNGYRPNTSFQQTRINVGINQKQDFKYQTKLTQSVIAGLVKNQFGANGFYAAPRDSASYEYVNTVWAGWTANLTGLPIGDFQFSMGARSNQDRYVFNQFNPSFYQNFHTTSVVNPMVQYSYRIRMAMLIKAAIEYRREAISSTNLGDRQREFWGKRVELIITPLKPEQLSSFTQENKRDLQISLGLYHVSNPTLGQVVYPGGSVLYRYKRHFITSRWGTGQRLPTFTDLYYKDPVNLSNPNLKVESSVYYDAGYRFNSGRFNFQGNAFQRDNSQLIDRIKDSLTAPWMPVNFLSMRVQGWDVGIQYQSKFKLGKTVFVRLSSTYSRLQAYRDLVGFTGISQYSVSFLPQQWISGIVFYNHKFQFSLYHRMIERANGNTPSQIPPPPGANTIYQLMDAKISANFVLRSMGKNSNFGHWDDKGVKIPLKVWLQVQNLTNESYRDFAAIPLLPRWVTFGMQIKI